MNRFQPLVPEATTRGDNEASAPVVCNGAVRWGNFGKLAVVELPTGDRQRSQSVLGKNLRVTAVTPCSPTLIGYLPVGLAPWPLPRLVKRLSPYCVGFADGMLQIWYGRNSE
eukprot:gb/GEZJ01004541.1/.p1 GENE.gb/GEZJ01004541.1/~~gb/GEZJ01004541.1/.p1  ORF type:complete len:112 (-),score=0.79 gb/GEZJ01004541.1/:443-778(-)